MRPRWYKLAYPTLILIAFLTAFAASAQVTAPVLELNAGSDRYPLAPYIELLEDPQRSYTIHDVTEPDVAAQFRPAHARSINLGVSKSAYWLRFTVHDNRPRGGILTALLLDLSWENLDSVRLYIPPDEGADYRMIETGTRYQTPPSPLRGMRPIIALDTEDGTTHTFHVRVEHEGALFLPAHIRSVESYLALNWLRSAINGFYIGMLFSIAVYNFLLFLAIRQRVYLLYVGYVAFGMIYYLFRINLFTETVFLGLPDIDDRARMAALAIAAICCFQFARDFLFTREQAPRADVMLRAASWTWAALACLIPLLSVNFLDTATSILGILSPLICLAAGISSHRQGFAPSRYFIAAWALLSIAYTLWSLMHLGLIPAEEYVPWILLGVSGFEIILLSFALSHRIRVLREEREAAGQRERRYREMAITDELTGLYNVRFFRAQIPLETQRAEKLSLPLSLALLDLDDFKKFNDTHGHPAGDAALRHVGQVILQCVRERDIACRYGGEEFVILFPATTIEEATEAADRIRLTYNQVRRSAGMPHYGATLSMGIAQMLPQETAEALIERADRALYQAKHSGKNRIVLAPARPPRPRQPRK